MKVKNSGVFETSPTEIRPKGIEDCPDIVRVAAPQVSL